MQWTCNEPPCKDRHFATESSLTRHLHTFSKHRDKEKCTRLTRASIAAGQASNEDEPAAPPGTILHDMPITLVDVTAYDTMVRARQGQPPWKKSTQIFIIKLYGFQDAPTTALSSLADMEKYLDEHARKQELKTKTIANYLISFKNSLLVRIWKHKISNPHIDKIKEFLTVTSTEATAHASAAKDGIIPMARFRHSNVPGVCLTEDPNERWLLYLRLRARWAADYHDQVDCAQKHLSGTLPADGDAEHLRLQSLRSLRSYILLGLLLFHPAQRIEVFKGLAYLPTASIDEIAALCSRRRKKHNRVRSVLLYMHSRTDPGSPEYVASDDAPLMRILVLNDKAASWMPTYIVIHPVIAVLVHAWLALRYSPIAAWGPPSSVFVFSPACRKARANSAPSADGSLSRDILQLVRTQWGILQLHRVHDCRHLCVAFVARACRGQASMLRALAVLMRHTTGCQLDWYGETVDFEFALIGNILYHQCMATTEEDLDAIATVMQQLTMFSATVPEESRLIVSERKADMDALMLASSNAGRFQP